MSVSDLNKGIEALDVVKRFRRGRDEVVLGFPDFRLAAGEHAVVTGPSGSGKTTLLHLLAGLLTTSEGTLRVAGQVLAELSESERDLMRASSVGYAFQDFHLLEGYTALENVMLGLAIAKVPVGERRTRAKDALTAVDLEARFHHLPRRLSTGERQRVALARAISHKPRLLLADEPTAHLDRARGEQAVKLLQTSADHLDAILVVATHDPAVISTFATQIEVRS